MANTVLQQNLIIEFIIQNLQCDDCKKTYTPHLWQSQVQIRQKVAHKRTFLWLEQLILKHKAQEKCIGVQNENHGQGLNFLFKHRTHGMRLCKFVEDNVVSREK